MAQHESSVQEPGRLGVRSRVVKVITQSSAPWLGKGQPKEEKSQMATRMFYTRRKELSDSENEMMIKDATKKLFSPIKR